MSFRQPSLVAVVLASVVGAVACGGSTTDAMSGPPDSSPDVRADGGGDADAQAPTPDAGPDGNAPADGGPHRDASSDAGSAEGGPADAGSGDGCAPSAAAAKHRQQAVACTASPADGGAPPGFDGGSLDQCLVDSDCVDGGVCSCRGSTFAWAHQSYGNSCVPANCRSDSDCGPGGACSPTVDFGCGPFYGVVGYYCHSCADECENDSDCNANPTAGGPAGYCAYDATIGHWSCGYNFCAG